MKSLFKNDVVNFSLSRSEALVLSETLTRLIDDDEKPLLSLLHSSAEFAVLCRLNNHLQSGLPELFNENYEKLLNAARKALIKESGHYSGIDEHDAA